MDYSILYTDFTSPNINLDYLFPMPSYTDYTIPYPEPEKKDIKTDKLLNITTEVYQDKIKDTKLKPVIDSAHFDLTDNCIHFKTTDGCQFKVNMEDLI